MFTRTISERGFRGGTETTVPKLFYRYDAKDGSAGHWRTFPRKMGGFVGLRHHWNVTAPGWAKSRVWNILGLVTIIHIDAGPDNSLKHTKEPGWHFRFAKVWIGCVGYKTYGIMFRSADASYGA